MAHANIHLGLAFLAALPRVLLLVPPRNKDAAGRGRARNFPFFFVGATEGCEQPRAAPSLRKRRKGSEGRAQVTEEQGPSSLSSCSASRLPSTGGDRIDCNKLYSLVGQFLEQSFLQ